MTLEGARASATVKHGLVVEDMPEVARGLTAMLQAAFPGICVRRAASLGQARRVLAETGAAQPDVVLLDLGLPDGDGTTLLAEGALPAACLTVVVTIFDDDSHLFAALRAGADGYLLKDEPEQACLAALRGLAAGQPPLSPGIASRILDSFRMPPAEASVHLAPRERDVLSVIAKGCSVRHTAEVLGMTQNTVASYLKEIYRKLQVNSRAEAALEAVRLGLISVDVS